MITRKELIKKYIDFFKSKDHKEIPNSSLIPINDPTVLFTTAGMHPLVPYLSGQKHPLGKRLVNVQRCIRTGDIDEVGDTTHHTFFEMLGNWSLGDYWKEESINFSYEFLTSKKWLGLDKKRLAFTIFSGDMNKKISVDNESKEIWKNLNVPQEKIINLNEDNWWGPAGNSGPCGPDTEIFYWMDKSKVPERFNPNDSTLATGGKGWVEIWNNVFMQYEKTSDGKYTPLKQKSIDTGMGLERTLAALNSLDDNYLTEVWQPIIKEIEKISGKKYEDHKKEMRILADHIKAASFIIADGVTPGNTGREYVLRRLIRRAIRYGKLLKIETNFTSKVSEPIFDIYQDYKELKENRKKILDELDKEESKFLKTLDKGMSILKKESHSISIKDLFSGKTAFLLYQSYGFPIEMTKEILMTEEGLDLDEKEFEQEYRKHQELSRTTSAGAFKSGLADHSEKTTRLHTTTHLLNEALSRVLGPEVAQRGSNITPERTRFDFVFNRKLTDEEVKKIEDLVNKVVKKGLQVKSEEIPYKDAIESGAKGEFGHKYPERVSVYTVVDKDEKKGYFSREICTGPHVKNTKEIGRIKIIEQSSVSAGVRRIKAIVED